MKRGTLFAEGLQKTLLSFRRERDWEQFHNLRTLSVTLALECAELVEVTQWASDEEVKVAAVRERARIQDEIADIAIVLAYLVNDLGIDLAQVVKAKLEKNAKKYPVAKARGVATKYDRL
ncbi:MAG TPA: nucleotide pyrophosphohydrolase [Candidatus Binatia bacterium]|nr:nucleotide pyrophosphohydrolase [Candidatus Binatia bacterium]